MFTVAYACLFVSAWPFLLCVTFHRRPAEILYLQLFFCSCQPTLNYNLIFDGRGTPEATPECVVHKDKIQVSVLGKLAFCIHMQDDDSLCDLRRQRAGLSVCA